MSAPVDCDRAAAEYDRRYSATRFAGTEDAVAAFACDPPGSA
jgi:hypothetical protein